MIATDKVVRIQVTKPFEKSALSRILELVQNASERKAPAELFIRKFARIYTPAVTGLAALIVLLPFLYSLADAQFSFIFNDWLYRALVFLVISCPCALVVSIPLGYFGGIGAASRLGVLFKGGNYLDAITQVNTVVFDKTGTLTKGTFDVQSCQAQPGVTEEKLIQLAASAERNSTHPIAKAIISYAKQRDIELIATTDVTEIAGHGLQATMDGTRVLVGNTRLLTKFGIEYPDELSSIVDTIVACAIGTKYAGYLLLSDTLKEDAVNAVKELKALNINNIQILSGDKQAIVTNFAEKLGITQAYGDLLPDGKVKHIEALRSNPANRIAFVGDGINDAPVLALRHGRTWQRCRHRNRRCSDTDRPAFESGHRHSCGQANPPDCLAEHLAGFRSEAACPHPRCRWNRHTLGSCLCRRRRRPHCDSERHTHTETY